MSEERPATGGCEKLETHHYDGHYARVLQRYTDQFERLGQSVTRNTMRSVIVEQLRSAIISDAVVEKRVKDAAIAMIDIIIDGPTEANIDVINHIDALVLMYVVTKCITQLINHDHDYIRLVATDLFDMYMTGRCPQGRATRLWQIFITINEQHDFFPVRHL